MALARPENQDGGNKRLVSEAVKNVRKGKTICEEDAGEIGEFIAEHAAELDEAGTSFHFARERLASGQLRQFLHWCNSKDVSESFNIRLQISFRSG